MIRNFLINLIFKLLGNSNTKTYKIQYLFGITSGSHESRKKRWEKALIRLWKDKDILDYLFYQSESDKEIVFKAKTSKDLSRGARLRTLFIVYSARRAYEESRKNKRSNATERGEVDSDIKNVQSIYKTLVNIDD